MTNTITNSNINIAATPLAVREKIDTLQRAREGHANKITSINGAIANLQQQRADAETMIRDVSRQLDIATFIRDQYDRTARTEAPEAEPTPNNNAVLSDIAAVEPKERIYAVLRHEGRPMRAAELAERVNMDVGIVGTYIGHLSRTHRVRPAEAGTWAINSDQDLTAPAAAG